MEANVDRRILAHPVCPPRERTPHSTDVSVFPNSGHYTDAALAGRWPWRHHGCRSLQESHAGYQDWKTSGSDSLEPLVL